MDLTSHRQSASQYAGDHRAGRTGGSVFRHVWRRRRFLTTPLLIFTAFRPLARPPPQPRRLRCKRLGRVYAFVTRDSRSAHGLGSGRLAAWWAQSWAQVTQPAPDDRTDRYGDRALFYGVLLGLIGGLMAWESIQALMQRKRGMAPQNVRSGGTTRWSPRCRCAGGCYQIRSLYFSACAADPRMATGILTMLLGVAVVSWCRR